MTTPAPTIAVLGASGLIGFALAAELKRGAHPVIAIARRFTSAQHAALGENAITAPFAAPDEETLAALLGGSDIVINAAGILQDRGGETADAIHRAFVARLIRAMTRAGRPKLLIHVSIPGEANSDRTAFSRTKRRAEQLIRDSGLPFVILRPGIVLAPVAYGASALFRALAALPVDLAPADWQAPFAAIGISDIVATVAVVADRWRQGERTWSATWDLMEREQSTAGDVVAGLRRHFGGPRPIVNLPSWLLTVGARLGDLASRLGWAPPVRSTGLAEMRRGVRGDPLPWIAATGIEPAPLGRILASLPATIQEVWFARLFLLKPFVVASLALFWTLSGLIALTVSFQAAAGILTRHGFHPALADAITVVSALADIAIGMAIAWRPACRRGLIAGIAVALGYMAGAAVLTPDLWIEPLGALVKTVPAVVLMLVAVAILDSR